jgi:oligopeptide transport system substrate-binding protein
VTLKFTETPNEACGEVDPKNRAAILAQAERILVADEAPIVPLVFGASNFLLDPRVEGFFGNALDMHPLKGVAKRAR